MPGEAYARRGRSGRRSCSASSAVSGLVGDALEVLLLGLDPEE
jgi:hypothetical protein